MSNELSVAQLVDEINNNLSLSGKLQFPVEGILVPLGRDPKSMFLALSVQFRLDEFTVAIVGDLMRVAVKLIHASPQLSSYPAMEVLFVASIQPESPVHRIVRCTVERESYELFLSTHDIDLRLNNPIAGVKCGWYKPPENF